MISRIYIGTKVMSNNTKSLDDLTDYWTEQYDGPKTLQEFLELTDEEYMRFALGEDAYNFYHGTKWNANNN